MQQGKVFRNNNYVGLITRTDEGKFVFEYDEQYINSSEAKAISLTLPINEKKFESDFIFPFFYNLLSEGTLKKIQCEKLRIDKNDDFSRLLKTTASDTIGSITIQEVI